MNSIEPTHIRNPVPVIGRVARRGSLLSAIGALLLAGAPGSAIQPQAGTTGIALSPVSPQPRRAATDTQLKLAAAAAAEGAQIDWNTSLGTPFSIRSKDLGERQTFSSGKGLKTAKSAPPEANAMAVLDNLSGIMGIREAQKEFAAKPAENDALGFRHVRADQIYQGLQVFGGEVIVHFNRAGAAYQVNGRYVPDINVDIHPALTPAEALARATEDLIRLGKSGAAARRQPELVVFAYQTAPRLAYALTLTCEPAIENAWRYWIDAQNGKVLMRYNDVKSADISGDILTGEGGGTVTIPDCYSDGVTNYLQNTNQAWMVYNISTNSSMYPDAMDMAFRTNTTWLPEDRTEMSAAYNIDLSQNYYRTVFNRHSYDNSTSTVLVIVHYEDPSYVNNAAWGGGMIVFGEGDGHTAAGMAVLDVCAHELTHGVDEYSANLIYAYESGALNESFSDIFGACIEFNSQPDGRANYPDKAPGTADWLLAEDCWLSSTAMRDMRNPQRYGDPSKYHGTYWYYGSGDNGGVHYNSGVQNFFFYLLSEGGSGTNDGRIYNVAGLGVSNAAQVAYRALTIYCNKYTDFTDIRNAWIYAAQDLTNQIPSGPAAVAQAWEAVGYGADPLADLGTVLHAPYLTWRSGGSAPWYGQNLITNQSPMAAQSGLLGLGNDMYSRLSTTVIGRGTFSFWWKVWSEPNYDILLFSINGNAQMEISGQSAWTRQAFTFTDPNRTNTLTWIYGKDGTTSYGLDAGWVADVAWEPEWNPGLPVITKITSGDFTDRIRITWQAMAGATGYRLYRNATANAGSATLLAELPPSSLIYDDMDAAIVPGTTYYYWLQGINCASTSSWSSSSSGYRALSPPAGISISKGGFTGKVKLTWTAAPGAISYQIMRNTINVIPATAIVETGATSYNDTTALPGVTYYYWLRSRKWQGLNNPLQSAFSAGDYGWRRSMAATDNAFCDFDGDGKADPAVYQRATGLWRIMMSGNRYRISSFQLGGAGYQPVPQDFDGDGKTDVAVYSQTTGQWLVLLSASGYSSAGTVLGGPGGIALPRDFDGDGKADPAVFDQPAGLWEAQYSSLNYALVAGNFGDASFTPSPADFDGDGRTDPAVFQVRPSVLGSVGYLLAILSANAYAPRDWNLSASGRIVPQDYDGDAQADPALFDSTTGLWNIWPSSIISSIPYSLAIGSAGFVPVAGDYDGDRKADVAVYQESTGTWVVRSSGSNYSPSTAVLGGPGNEAVAAFP